MALFAVPEPKAPLGDFLSSHVQAFAGSELKRMFSERALRTALSHGAATRVLPGIYAATAHAGAFHVRAQAASRWSKAPISGAAALFVWGLLEQPPASIEVAVPAETRLRGPAWVTARRTGREIATTTRNGLLVVTPAVAIVTGFGRIPPQWRAEVVFRAARTGLVGAPQLRRELAAAPKVKARRSLESHIEAVERGAHSWLEERGLRSVFNTKVFATFVRQHEIVVEGEQFFLDMFEPGARLAIELDGDKFHGDREQRMRDIRRDAIVATRGIQTLRMSRWDLVHRPEWCRLVVASVLEARRGVA